MDADGFNLRRGLARLESCRGRDPADGRSFCLVGSLGNCDPGLLLLFRCLRWITPPGGLHKFGRGLRIASVGGCSTTFQPSCATANTTW
jgi:hypothetical protein